MFKKIIPLILSSSIVFSCIAPAYAADAPTTGEVVNSIVQETLGSSMFNFAVVGISTGIGTYFGQPQVGAFLGGVLADGIETYADYLAVGYTDQNIYDQFTNYNAQLETDLGSASIGCDSDGQFLLYTFESKSVSSAGQRGILATDLCTTGATTYVRGYSSMIQSVDYQNTNCYISYYPITAPCAGKYSTFSTYEFNGQGTTLTGVQHYVRHLSSVSEGQGMVVSTYYPGSSKYYTLTPSFRSEMWKEVWFDFYVTAYAKFYSNSGFGDTLTDSDLTINSRPTSLVTPIAIQNPDQTYTVYNNITLVDEGNKVVFDPTTGESITFTDWVYDYDSRTYDLTLDGGGNITVQFGNDSITMTQGDTVTNMFYVQDPANDPGTDDPDTPGTDDPDTPGTEADVSGFFDWWKNAWNAFTDRLFTALDGGDLEVILPGEEGNPESEEDDGWTVFDLFALVRDALWKIITGVITVVLDGFLGLVDAIASLGDFFDVYDTANPDGIFGVPGGGVALWS